MNGSPASFEHPFIARLLDAERLTDGVPYCVMEFVEGQTFYTYCDANKLDVRESSSISESLFGARLRPR